MSNRCYDKTFIERRAWKQRGFVSQEGELSREGNDPIFSRALLSCLAGHAPEPILLSSEAPASSGSLVQALLGAQYLASRFAPQPCPVLSHMAAHAASRGEVDEEEDVFPVLRAVAKARSRGNPLAVQPQGRDLPLPVLGAGVGAMAAPRASAWATAAPGGRLAAARRPRWPQSVGEPGGGAAGPRDLQNAAPRAELPCAKGDFPFSSGRKFLTRKDKESIFTMDHFPLWYRRAAEHPPGSFIYSIVSEDDSGNLVLNARKMKRKLWARSDPFIASVA